jgi:gluconokinase
VPKRQRLTSLVLIGPAGSGKSTVMAALADRLGWRTLEGDDLHPAENVARMAAGIPLTDADRVSWLASVAAWIRDRERERANSIVTCSALRRRYRDVLRDGHPWVWFVHLDVPPEILRERLERRTGHFMAASMLGSQLAAFEPLEPDEPGTSITALAPPTALADEIVETLGLDR